MEGHAQILPLRVAFHTLPLFHLHTQILSALARKNNATVEINPYRVDFCVHCSLFSSPIVPDWLDKSLRVNRLSLSFQSFLVERLKLYTVT